MGKCRPILAAITKSFAKGHFDEVCGLGVECPIATMAKGNGDPAEERSPTGLIFADGDRSRRNNWRFRSGIEGFRQTFDLFGIEHGIAAQNTPGFTSLIATGTLGLGRPRRLAITIRLISDLGIIDDKGSALAFSNTSL
jgi:hypothetical protein